MVCKANLCPGAGAVSGNRGSAHGRGGGGDHPTQRRLSLSFLADDIPIPG